MKERGKKVKEDGKKRKQNEIMTENAPMNEPKWYSAMKRKVHNVLNSKIKTIKLLYNFFFLFACVSEFYFHFPVYFPGFAYLTPQYKTLDSSLIIALWSFAIFFALAHQVFCNWVQRIRRQKLPYKKWLWSAYNVGREETKI